MKKKHASFKNEANQSEKERAKVADYDKLRNNLEAYDTGDNTFSTSDRRPENLQMESKPKMTVLEWELLENISDMDKLNSLKEEEIDTLRSSDMELETEISNHQNVNARMIYEMK